MKLIYTVTGLGRFYTRQPTGLMWKQIPPHVATSLIEAGVEIEYR